MDSEHRLDEHPWDPLAGDEPEVSAPTSVGLQVLLVVSLLAVGVVLVLPLIMLLTVAGSGTLLTAAAMVMAHTGGLARWTFHQGMITALVLVVVATAAHYITRPLLKRHLSAAAPAREADSQEVLDRDGVKTTTGRGYSGPLLLFLRYPLPALWLVIVAIGCPLVWLEWGNRSGLPDLLTAAVVLTALLAGVLALVVLFLLVSYRGLRRLFGLARGRPFLAGAVSGSSAVVVALALGLGWLTTAALEEGPGSKPGPDRTLAARSQPLGGLSPSMAVASVGTGGAADESMEATRQVFLMAAKFGTRLAGLMQADSCPLIRNEFLLQHCFHVLGEKSGGESEREKVIGIIRRKFELPIHDAEDITMNALISICQRHSASPMDNLKAALRTAARNEAIDLYNRRRREFPLPPDNLEPKCILWPTDESRLKSEVRIAQRACDTLAPQQQKAVGLWADGNSRKEIARKLDVSNKRACILVDNSFKKLRRAVEKYCRPPRFP